MGMRQTDSVRARAVELGRLNDRYEALRRAARAPEMRRFLAAALDLVLIYCLIFVSSLERGLSWDAIASGTVLLLLRDVVIPGVSPGKFIFNLRVFHDHTLQRPSRGQCLLRNLLYLIVCLPRMIAAIVVLILAALLPFILGFALSTLFQSWSSLVFGYEEIESRTSPDRASGTKVLPTHELIALRSAALKFRKVQAEFAETAN